MEEVARTLNNHTLLNIALTYQGDMFRRLGRYGKAITYLEVARYTTPGRYLSLWQWYSTPRTSLLTQRG